MLRLQRRRMDWSSDGARISKSNAESDEYETAWMESENDEVIVRQLRDLDALGYLKHPDSDDKISSAESWERHPDISGWIWKHYFDSFNAVTKNLLETAHIKIPNMMECIRLPTIIQKKLQKQVINNNGVSNQRTTAESWFNSDDADISLCEEWEVKSFPQVSHNTAPFVRRKEVDVDCSSRLSQATKFPLRIYSYWKWTQNSEASLRYLLKLLTLSIFDVDNCHLSKRYEAESCLTWEEWFRVWLVTEKHLSQRKDDILKCKCALKVCDVSFVRDHSQKVLPLRKSRQECQGNFVRKTV